MLDQNLVDPGILCAVTLVIVLLTCGEFCGGREIEVAQGDGHKL